MPEGISTNIATLGLHSGDNEKISRKQMGNQRAYRSCPEVLKRCRANERWRNAVSIRSLCVGGNRDIRDCLRCFSSFLYLYEERNRHCSTSADDTFGVLARLGKLDLI